MPSIPQVNPPFAAQGRTEAQLIALARRSPPDPEAFGELYRLHYRTIAGYLLRRTGEYHTAEDLACETFIAAYRGMHRYKPSGIPFRSWLYRIATNIANGWAGRRGRMRLMGLEGAAESRMAVGASEGRGDIAVDEAQAAMLSLSAEHQAALSLHYLEGLSVEELSKVLGTRVGTVKSRLARARARLKAEIEDRRGGHE